MSTPTPQEVESVYTEAASAARALTEVQTSRASLRGTLRDRERGEEAAQQRLAAARARVRDVEARAGTA